MVRRRRGGPAEAGASAAAPRGAGRPSEAPAGSARAERAGVILAQLFRAQDLDAEGGGVRGRWGPPGEPAGPTNGR